MSITISQVMNSPAQVNLRDADNARLPATRVLFIFSLDHAGLLLPLASVATPGQQLARRRLCRPPPTPAAPPRPLLTSTGVFAAPMHSLRLPPPPPPASSSLVASHAAHRPPCRSTLPSPNLDRRSQSSSISPPPPATPIRFSLAARSSALPPHLPPFNPPPPPVRPPPKAPSSFYIRPSGIETLMEEENDAAVSRGRRRRGASHAFAFAQHVA